MNSTARRRDLIWAAVLMILLSVVWVARGESAGAGAPPTDSTDVVYIATGANFPDALGAAAAAGASLAPVLLVTPDSIPQPTLDELNRLTPEKIVIVGGTAVVSDGVETSLAGLAFSPSVTRVAGANRYATAAALSAAVFPTQGLYPVAAHVGGDQVQTVIGTQVVRSITIDAPTTGTVIVNSTATAAEFDPSEGVRCSITTGTTIDVGFTQEWDRGPDPAGNLAQLAGTRGFDVGAGEFTANLVCENVGVSGASDIYDSAMTAIFVADI